MADIATILAAHRTGSIIIQFEDGASALDRSQALAAIHGVTVGLVAKTDAGEVSRAGLGEGMTIEKAIEVLSAMPGVKFAEPDYLMTPSSVSNDTAVAAGTTWGLYGDVGTQVNIYGSQASEAWAAGYTGSTKVAVGVIDTGIDYTHPDLYLNIWLNPGEIPTALKAVLKDVDADGLITFRDLNNAANASHVADKNANGRIDAGDLLNDVRWENGVDEDGNGFKDDLIGWDFQNDDNDPMDDAGHGTHVAGTIGASGGNGVGVAGVAWNTQLVALKFMDAAGGYVSDGVQAADYFTNAAKASTKVDFVATNNSWGGSGFSLSLQDAVVRGAIQDILFVAAASNGGADNKGDNNDVTANYPSNLSTLVGAGYEAVISVASITKTGTLSTFSNYGRTSVDLAAPGQGIYSTLLGGGYGQMSGTSMATPHVTGAIALYAAAAANLSAARIRADILNTTADTDSLDGKTVTGGRLDVGALLAKLGVAGAPSGVISGTAGDDLITTTATVAGQARAGTGADTLQGLGGDDTLDGGAGNDRVDGGAGADELSGGTGADTLLGDDGADRLDGGAGADRMDGGAGSDTYYVDNAGDVVIETLATTAGGTSDKVISTIDYSLGANVERLTLSGSAAIDGTGNSLGNLMTGNSGDNRLSGLSGNDTLNGGNGDDTLLGGAGVDVLSGGAGEDVFIFARGQAAGDTIKDFAAGDHIQLTGYSAGSTLAHVAGTDDWKITDKSTGVIELLHLTNGHTLTAGEFLFA